MRAVQCPTLQDALDRFRHIEVRAREGSEEGHDAVSKEPQHEVDGVVAGEVIPDEQHAEWGQVLWQGDPDRESFLPALPPPAVLIGREHLRLGQCCQDGGQFRFEPGMEHGIGGVPYSFHPHLTAGRPEERELLGRPCPDVLMRVTHRLSGRMPVSAGIGQRPVGPRFVLGPHRQLVLGVRCLDQVFFATASGSVTVTVPLFRVRTALPISHQLRSLVQANPASCRTHQMV